MTQDCTTNKQQELTGCDKKTDLTGCEKKQELKGCEKNQELASIEKKQASTGSEQKQKLTDCKIKSEIKISKDLKKDFQMSMKNDSAKKVAEAKSQATALVSKAATTLSKNSAATQLVAGSVAGWTTGFLAMKMGRTTAFIVGGSIIAFQLAQNTGYVKTDWDKVREKVNQTTKKIDATLKYKENSPKLVASAFRFARSNTCFAAGFVGGFLIGLAS